MKKNRFLFLAGFLALAVLFPFSAFAGGQAAKGPAGEEDLNYVVKIARSVTNGLCSAPLFIAEALGYYEEEGLKWEAVFQSSGDAQMNITTGKTDVTTGLIATTIMPVVNGYDVKIPLGIHTGCSKILVRGDSGITDIFQLIGKKVGTSSLNGSGVILLQRTLGEAGYKILPPNADFDLVVFQSSDLPLAISNGSVDAVIMGEPTATVAEEEQGLKVIFDSALSEWYREEFCCVLLLRSGFADEHPQVAAKFTRAIQKASAYVQENPLKTTELMAEKQYVAGDPVRNAAILATYNYKASVSQARIAISRNLIEMKRVGIIPSDVDVDPDELTNRLFVQLPGVPDSLYDWIGK
ncbi:MAG: ABC transporter substrate-binding protein [Treponema sp.]|jgi:NitT/TauT family transport system substrate-binding protein|nr:ABC transporter substrate-binding protein [Treponema sp.]